MWENVKKNKENREKIQALLRPFILVDHVPCLSIKGSW